MHILAFSEVSPKLAIIMIVRMCDSYRNSHVGCDEKHVTRFILIDDDGYV